MALTELYKVMNTDRSHHTEDFYPSQNLLNLGFGDICKKIFSPTLMFYFLTAATFFDGSKIPRPYPKDQQYQVVLIDLTVSERKKIF